MAVPRFKRWRRAIRAGAIRAAISLLMRLPLGAALAIGAFLGRIGWYLAPRARRAMRESLAVAFPEKSPAERDAIGRASLVHLGMVAGEVVSMRSWEHRIEEYVHVSPETLARVKRARASGNGIVMVKGHIGNWELTRRLTPYVQPCAAIAKRSWHPKLDELTERFREAGGLATLWREDAATARNMLRVLKNGGALAILIDQDTNVQSVFVPFFGHLAATPRGAADLALRFGATVLLITCRRRGPRRGAGHVLEAVEVPFDADAPDREAEVLRLTAACTALQESAIRANPAEWVWMHQRWKTQPEAASDQANAVPEIRSVSRGVARPL
ncbi:MAG TPA: lipid A biosynthesis acyltransferase [Anaeromyxobacteraceae bacterium]|nr:lipid A biosynthesis acyltransferase [Anaeromyxobacteraceae bacterium]